MGPPPAAASQGRSAPSSATLRHIPPEKLTLGGTCHPYRCALRMAGGPCRSRTTLRVAIHGKGARPWGRSSLQAVRWLRRDDHEACHGEEAGGAGRHGHPWQCWSALPTAPWRAPIVVGLLRRVPAEPSSQQAPSMGGGAAQCSGERSGRDELPSLRPWRALARDAVRRGAAKLPCLTALRSGRRSTMGGEAARCHGASSRARPARRRTVPGNPFAVAAGSAGALHAPLLSWRGERRRRSTWPSLTALERTSALSGRASNREGIATSPGCARLLAMTMRGRSALPTAPGSAPGVVGFLRSRSPQ